MKRIALLLTLALSSLATAQQELTSGATDECVYFVAVDATDLHTRETGLLAAGFTVSYSINGGADTLMTTPAVTEVDATSQPGEYKLLVDEAGMTTLASGKNQANMILSVSHASIDRTTISCVVKRPVITGGETLDVQNGAASTLPPVFSQSPSAGPWSPISVGLLMGASIAGGIMVHRKFR